MQRTYVGDLLKILNSRPILHEEAEEGYPLALFLTIIAYTRFADLNGNI